MLARHMGRTALMLATFAVVGTGLVALTYAITEPRIAEAERTHMLQSLNAVIKPDSYDNDIFNDFIEVTDPDLLGTTVPVTVFRARRGEQPVAVAIIPTAPEGYVGPIKLLVGIDMNGTILGVRVLTHKETPGLGDKIEERRSHWIFSFDGHSLKDPEPKAWRVRRDGGQFDQFTGATITPRAIVKAVYNTLKFFEANKLRLFTTPSDMPASTSPKENS